MMYVMFTGDYPFGNDGSTKTVVFTSIAANAGSVSLSGKHDIFSDISESAEKCIIHLLQRQPDQRLGRGGISQVCLGRVEVQVRYAPGEGRARSATWYSRSPPWGEQFTQISCT
jgi:hypothetical protein